jgi:hypothetical protein
MNVALWILQVLLALFFGFGGVSKAFFPLEQLAQQGAWVKDVPVWMVRLPGYAEILAALGLILPAATRIRPRLTGYAAVGLMVVMALAAILHIGRGEWGMTGTNLVLLGLAGFVAWGRLSASPIPPRRIESTAAAADESPRAEPEDEPPA